MTRCLRWMILAGALLPATLALHAHAAEPRPWLCRDKPVFSSDTPMNYTVKSSTSHPWQVFFMQFSPGASHDGFDISQSVLAVSTNEQRGNLPAGRYFVVALHRGGASWICHGSAESQSRGAGTVTDLCFAESSGCPVHLTVSSSTGQSSPH